MNDKQIAVRSLLMAAVFFLSSLCIGPAWAAKGDPGNRWPNAHESGSYQAKIASTGQVLWWVNWKTRVAESSGGKRVEIQEEGKGRPWKYKEPITWKKEMVFRTPPSQGEEKAASAVFVESVRGTRWTQKGDLLGEIDISRDATGQQVVYRDSQPGKPIESAALKWTPQLLPDELLFHWARTIPFEESGKAEFLLWVSPKRSFRIKAQLQGTETVTTPAGTFSCYRVDLRPELFGPLENLAPRLSLWCATQAPHFWVRYRGPVGGPGSPEALIELVKFRQESEGR